MDLGLNPDLGRPFRNPAQATRAITEGWARENLYCLDCEGDRLAGARTGKKVIDFRCQNCHHSYQLKSQKHLFRNRVLDAAWQPMVSAIKAGKAPSFLFLHYDPARWHVENLFGVPSHFMSLSAIEKRRPLAETARRAGWVGCNILLRSLPPDARVQVVRNHAEIPPAEVRRNWNRFNFLAGEDQESRGWVADVLVCVRRLNQRMFTLKDVYRFEDQLSKLHPRNQHIKAKIRQQLQMLRDQGIIKFLGGGNYLTID